MRKNDLDIANGLITYFNKLFTDKFDEKPILNRGKIKFALAEILQDWKQSELKSFIEYYVRTSSQPDLSDFCRRYDEIIQDKKIEELDATDRKQLMSETKKSVLRFREQYKGAK